MTFLDVALLSLNHLVLKVSEPNTNKLRPNKIFVRSCSNCRMRMKATGFGHNSSRVSNTSGLTLSHLPLGLFCMHWLHVLLLSSFFHMATEFSGFIWTLVFHYQKTELCILSLVPKITRKGLTKSSLIYLPGLGLYAVLKEIGDCDYYSSSHFTNPPGQGDKALWKDAT